jgi:hypothetical protein
MPVFQPSLQTLLVPKARGLNIPSGSNVDTLYRRRAVSSNLPGPSNGSSSSESDISTESSSVPSLPAAQKHYLGHRLVLTAEHARLDEDESGVRNWKRWGPYLSERQWATVREDYSADGDAWSHFPHDHARSRAYRWGEDGLAGLSDDKGLLCWSLALWNGVDDILKERLFGVTGHEGNHGEDVKELYYYLDSTV